MNDLLVSLFRLMFGFLAWTTAFLCIFIGGWMVIIGQGHPVVAWTILIGGPASVVIAGGAIALMIQNNDLLRQIAKASAKP